MSIMKFGECTFLVVLASFLLLLSSEDRFSSLGAKLKHKIRKSKLNAKVEHPGMEWSAPESISFPPSPSPISFLPSPAVSRPTLPSLSLSAHQDEGDTVGITITAPTHTLISTPTPLSGHRETHSKSDNEKLPSIRRSVTGVVTPPATRVHPKGACIHHDSLILSKILAFSSSSHLRAEDPFFQDRTTNLWLGSLRTLKSLCLVSKPCYAIAAPLLYKHIRLRRIPQLSALAASLQSNNKRPSNSQSFSLPMRLGDHTKSLDLSFFIPKEWNTLYVSDLLTLLPMLPKLTSFRSRPCLPILSQSGAPIPRLVPRPILLALAHSQHIKRTLTELELTQQESPALTDLATLLQNCISLSTLTLGFHIFDSGSVLSPATSSIRIISLESLKLHVTMTSQGGVLTAEPAAPLMIDTRRWFMPKLRNLSLILDHDIQTLSSVSPFGGILHDFLNMHGHAIRHLSVIETAPYLRSKVLDVSSLVSKCPELECLTVGIVGWAPVRVVAPHGRLRRMQLVGTLRWISVGGDALLARGRQALEIQAAEVRAGKLPGLRDVVLMDEREVPREWAEAMRSVNVSISCMRAGDESEKDIWSDGEGSEDDNWVLPPRNGEDDVSGEGTEDDGWYTDTSASGGTTSFVGGDQIDHISALKIFEKSLKSVIWLPKDEDSDSEVGVTSPPVPAPSLVPTQVSPPAVAPAPIPTRGRRFDVSSVMDSSPDAKVPPSTQQHFPKLGSSLGRSFASTRTRPTYPRAKRTLPSIYSKTAPKSTLAYSVGGLPSSVSPYPPYPGVPLSGFPYSGSPYPGFPPSGSPYPGFLPSRFPSSGLLSSGLPSSRLPSSGLPSSGLPSSGLLSSMVPEPKLGVDKGNIGSAKVVNHDSILFKEGPTL